MNSLSWSRSWATTVQRQRSHAAVGVLQRATRSGIHSLRLALQRLIDECPVDATIRAAMRIVLFSIFILFSLETSVNCEFECCGPSDRRPALALTRAPRNNRWTWIPLASAGSGGQYGLSASSKRPSS